MQLQGRVFHDTVFSKLPNRLFLDRGDPKWGLSVVAKHACMLSKRGVYFRLERTLPLQYVRVVSA